MLRCKFGRTSRNLGGDLRGSLLFVLLAFQLPISHTVLDAQAMDCQVCRELRFDEGSEGIGVEPNKFICNLVSPLAISASRFFYCLCGLGLCEPPCDIARLTGVVAIEVDLCRWHIHPFGNWIHRARGARVRAEFTEHRVKFQINLPTGGGFAGFEFDKNLANLSFV